MEINKSNAKECLVSGTWITNGSMKPFKGADDSKSFTLNVKFDKVSVEDIINKALEPTKIQWVNGPGRTGYDKFENKSIITIDFKAPGKTAVDPKQALIANAKAAGVDVTNIKALMAYIESEIAKGL